MIECVLLVTAVLLVCIYFFTQGGPMSKSVNASLNGMVNEVANLNSQIKI